jgi:hypothetical protein
MLLYHTTAQTIGTPAGQAIAVRTSMQPPDSADAKLS